jgi:hypothetical protein
VNRREFFGKAFAGATIAALPVRAAETVTRRSPSATDAPSGDFSIRIGLTSAAPSGVHPFCFAHPFRDGDAPESVTLDVPGAQVVVKRRWQSGAVKHALFFGHTAFKQNVRRDFRITRAPREAPGKALTPADVRAAKPSASLTCGTFGTASLERLLDKPPAFTWVSTSEVIDCAYFGAIDKTLGAWFYVKLFSDGRMHVRVQAIHAAFTIGSGEAKNYAPRITIGGRVVYDNNGQPIAHPYAAEYKAESWIGVDPKIVPHFDLAYLDSTRLFPHYDPQHRRPSEKILSSFPQEYAPFQSGAFAARMHAPGFHGQLGILPQWEALFLNTGDIRVYRATLAHSDLFRNYSIGWGRHPVTRLPITPSEYPDWSMRGRGGGGGTGYTGGPIEYEQAHAPSAGYTAYVLTGDYWHLETMALHSSVVYLSQNVGEAGLGTQRWIVPQIRGVAWTVRTMSQYVGIAPDGDSTAADYRKLLAFQFRKWRQLATMPGAAQLGIPAVWSTYKDGGPLQYGMFNYFYWVSANALAVDLEPGFDKRDQENLLWLTDFMFKIPVGMLGENDGKSYCFGKADEYQIQLSDKISHNFQWMWAPDLYPDWGTVYRKNFGTAPCTNVLGGKPEWAAGGGWGLILSALAGAIDHNVTGAAQSLQRVRRASNWDVIARSGFDDVPNYAIVPREKKA